MIWLGLALMLGVASAMLKGTIWDPLLMIVALIGISIPVFWLGEVANLVTQSRYHDTFLFSWVPPLGYVSLTSDPVGWFKRSDHPLDRAGHRCTSACTRGCCGRRCSRCRPRTTSAPRGPRACPARRVLIRHTLRTSLITWSACSASTSACWSAAPRCWSRSCSACQGVGYLTYLSLRALDLPVIMATVIYGAFFVVLANAMVDVAYAWLDPRVRLA